MRRRRPLLPEEKDRRSLRQVSTGRGQANARPVTLSLARVRTQRPPAGAFASANYHDTRTNWDSNPGADTQMVPDTLESSIGAAFSAYDVGDFYGVAILADGWYSGWAAAMASGCTVATIEIFADPVMVEGFTQVHRALASSVLSAGFDGVHIFLSATSSPVFCPAGTLWRASVYGDGGTPGAVVTQARMGLIHHA